MSQEKSSNPKIPEVLKVGKDEHLFIVMDGNEYDFNDLKNFRDKLEKQFPKLNGRVLLILGTGIQLAKV